MRTRPPGCDQDRPPGLDDAWLRKALSRLVLLADWRGHPAWEAIGAGVMQRAERDSRGKGFAEDYRGAYAATAISYLRTAPHAVLAADSPWGAVVLRARHAGDTAVGEALSGGLHARDDHRHRTHLSLVPQIVSFDPTAHDRPMPTRP